MKINKLFTREVKTKEEARQLATKYQTILAKINISYSELAECQDCFISLAKKFHLIREFKENAII